MRRKNAIGIEASFMTEQEERGTLSSSEFPIQGAQFSDLQTDKLARYIKHRASPFAPRLENGHPLTATATSLGLARQQGEMYVPTLAGLLFFGAYPQQFILQSAINTFRFRGLSRAPSILLQRELIESTAQFVKRNMRVAGVIGAVFRQDIPEYPETAVREAIINAVIHRDYNIQQKILLRVFDDCLELESPGGLAGHVTRETLSEQHFARNLRLAHIAQELRLAECAGTGIPRMLYELARLGSPPPEFIVTAETFTVRFWSRHRDLEALIAEHVAR
jgi:ATP-dependent DNA helicase RecG